MNTTVSQNNTKPVTKRVGLRLRAGLVSVAAVAATAAALVGGLFASSATARAAIVGGNANVSTSGRTVTVTFTGITSDNSGGFQLPCNFSVDGGADGEIQSGYLDNGGNLTLSGNYSVGRHKVESFCVDQDGRRLLDSRTVFLTLIPFPFGHVGIPWSPGDLLRG